MGLTPGTFYVVATPLGHLADLTERARAILTSVATVAAEDTRRTRRLLSHLGAHPRLVSYHEHSPRSRTDQLLTALESGEDVALVSDAGSPVLSDPGADLIEEVRARGLPVVPIPGASAIAAALSVAGLPADRFVFLGFLPRKGRERKRLLDRTGKEEWTMVFFESPNRLVSLLEDLLARAGDQRRALVAREMTKIHEEYRPGTLRDLADYYSKHPPQGEVTLVLAGCAMPPEPSVSVEQVTAEAARLLAQGMTRRAIVNRLTESSGLARNHVYRLVMEL